MPDEDKHLPETQTEREGGGRRKPPRRTAIGLFDFGDAQRKRLSVRQLWASSLADAFKRMHRSEQEALIVRLCQISCVFTAIVLTSFFYQFVPILVRVLGLPTFIIGSWFVATRVLSPIVIAHYEMSLNSETS